MEKGLSRERLQHFTACALLFLSALAMRLARIGQESLFIDEAVTRLACNGPVWEHVRFRELTPPLYFCLIRGWAAIFGDGDVAMRVPSALLGAWASPVLFAAARRMALAFVPSLLAAVCLAISPLSLWHSQLARPYAMLSLMAAVWVWAAAGAIRRPSRGQGAILAAATFAGVATHYHFAFLALGAALAAAPVVSRNGPRERIMPFLFGDIGGLLASAAFLPLALRQIAVSPPSELPRPSLHQLEELFFQSFVVGPFHTSSRWAVMGAGIGYAAAALGLILMLAGRRRAGRAQASQPTDAQFVTVLLGAAAGGILLPFAAARCGVSIFLADRYIIATLPPFLLALVYPLAACPIAALRGILAVALVGVMIPVEALADVDYWSRRQEFDWRGAGALIEREWRKGDAVVLLPGWMGLTYSANRIRLEPTITSDHEAMLRATWPRRLWFFYWEGDPEEPDKRLADRLKGIDGAKVRVDFPHIRLWEIPGSGLAVDSNDPPQDNAGEDTPASMPAA